MHSFTTKKKKKKKKIDTPACTGVLPNVTVSTGTYTQADLRLQQEKQRPWYSPSHAPQWTSIERNTCPLFTVPPPHRHCHTVPRAYVAQAVWGPA